MSFDEIAIQVKELSKHYYMYQKPEDRLKQYIMPRIQGLLGRQVKNYYREFSALHNISFEVKKGEAVGIIGRNGAGKSTLLQLICGTLTPSSGQIQVNGKVAALLELGSGFNIEFAGRENVYLNASLLGLSKEETDNKFDEIAAFADIGEYIDQPVKTYSSGMLMRLAFAVNTCVEPDIMIVDEALGVGDAPFQSKCFKRLRALIENGTTILFVSHDISTVRSICSRALWLKNGHTEMWGEAMKVCRQYEIFCWKEQGVEISATSEIKMDVIQTTNTRKADASLENIESFAGTDRETLPFNYKWPSYEFSPLASSDRYGNHEIKIMGFEVRNNEDDIVKSCAYGEMLTFIYYLEVFRDIESSVTIGLIFRNKLGAEIYSATNFLGDDKFIVKKGQKIIAYANLTIPLTHQDYIIQIGVFGFQDGSRYVRGEYDFSRAIIWDGIEKASVLTVAVNKPQPLSGPVHVPMNFSYEII